MSQRWICLINGKECGPYSNDKVRELVKAATLGPNDLIRRDGHSTWKKVKSLPGLMALISTSNTSDAGTNRKKQSRKAQRGGEANETVIRLLASATSKLALLLGAALVPMLLLAGWWLWPQSTSTSTSIPTADSAGRMHSGTLDDFVRHFRPQGRHNVSYSGVAPGQVEWTGEFQSSENFGLVRIRIPDSSPIDFCFVSAQDAIAQWKAMTAGTTVRFSAVLSGDVMFDEYQGMSVLPTGFKIVSNQIKPGGGEFNASRPEHSSTPAIRLFVDELRSIAINVQQTAASQMTVLNFETRQKVADMTIDGEDASLWDVQFSPVANKLAIARSPNCEHLKRGQSNVGQGDLWELWQSLQHWKGPA